MKTASCYTVRYCDISAEVGVLCEHKQTPSLLYTGTGTHARTHTQSLLQLSYDNISTQL